MRALIAIVALLTATAAGAQEPAGLDRALQALARDGKFSGAVVIMGPEGVRFARGYGAGDPFEGRAFTPDTPSESGSLAKPVTAAAILLLEQEGRIDLDAPARRYLSEYPDAETSVRHLLSHAAGLPDYDAFMPIAGKTTSHMLRELGARKWQPPFAPGTAFLYCNVCYDALALIVERVSGQPYQQFIDARLLGPAGARSSRLRPARLSDWRGRAIGYRRTTDGRLERHDSWEGEAFYGGGNIAFTANDLAKWGDSWASGRIRPALEAATRAPKIGGRRSGLTLGSWYCSRARDRCHYPGHHEGFHGYVYWDVKRRLTVAMLSNNTLSAALQQRLQRALVRFAEGRVADGESEIADPLPMRDAAPGRYRLPREGWVDIAADGRKLSLNYRGVRYTAYPAGGPVRYVPGLDIYFAGTSSGGLHWLSLYEDITAQRVGPNK